PWPHAPERRPRRGGAVRERARDPDSTVAGTQPRLRHERVEKRLAEAGTIALPTFPIPEQTRRDSSPDRLPWRVPRTVPPPRPPSGRVLVPRLAFAAPDNELMQRILDGLRKLD